MDITELNRLDPAKRVNRHPWEIARAYIISFFLNKYQPVSRLMADIGSGDAFVLGKLVREKHAERYIAIDTAYTPEIIARLESNVHDQAVSFYTESTSLQATGEKADCFLLLDVLEHCEDDKAVINSITRSRFVEDNALFVITVPAFSSLFSKHDELLNHYRRYNRKQLATLTSSAGLEIIDSGYFFHGLIPVRMFQRFLEKIKLRKPVSSLDNWKGNKPITRLFYVILWADFRVGYFFTKIGFRFPGLSCYCICRKLPS